jgi:S1-C subfamily serine protease
MRIHAVTALAAALLVIPGTARAQRAKSPADATVFVRLVGSLHAEINEGGIVRTAQLDHVELGTGSGFVISPHGYVLTNDHVVNQREQVVTTKGGGRAKISLRVSRIDVCFPRAAAAAAGLGSQCAEAAVTASNPTLDLAMLFVGMANLPYIALGDSDVVTTGLAVEALGYPFGRDVEVGKIASTPDLVPEITSTQGAVSALRTDDNGDRRYLQISNGVNPGNSGGPVVDRDGFAVGVIRMRLAKGAGIGFAIPINEVKEFVESHGLSQMIPARRLRLGPFQRLDHKGMGLRLVDGLADASPFRSRVENDARPGDVTLRIDRVLSPWSLKQLEQALVASHAFERAALSPPPGNGSSRAGNTSLVSGHAIGTAIDDESEIRMEYAVLDLGAEKLVARYVGPAEQVAFNQSVLRDSLASLDGRRLALADSNPTVDWRQTSLPNGLASLTMPAGWVVEPGGPAPCASLPPPQATTTTFAPHDFTVALRAAAWVARDVAPENAASACASQRGSLGAASYLSRVQWLGVSYSVEGVFVQRDPQHVIQLEVLAPEQKRDSARALLAAWFERVTAQRSR